MSRLCGFNLKRGFTGEANNIKHPINWLWPWAPRGISGEWCWRAWSRCNTELNYSFVIICPMTSNSRVAKGAEGAGLDPGYGREREILGDKMRTMTVLWSARIMWLLHSLHGNVPGQRWLQTAYLFLNIKVFGLQSVAVSSKKTLSHYPLNQPPTPLRFMLIFINPVRHKRSLMLKPILSQSRGSEWNVCSAGVLSVCSQLRWNRNLCT